MNILAIGRLCAPLTALAASAALVACGADDTADRYVGTWVSACQPAGLESAATGEALKARYRLTLDKRSERSLGFAIVQQVYPASGCDGEPLATHANRGAGNTYVLDDDRRLPAGHHVERITVTMQALGGGAPANGIRYPADFFISTVDGARDLLSLDDQGRLYFGTGDTVDAEGYPVRLATAAMQRG